MLTISACALKGEYCHSTDWVLERGKIVLSPSPFGGWVARSFMDAVEHHGETPQIAAKRCYVSDQRGDEVEIPDELVSAQF